MAAIAAPRSTSSETNRPPPAPGAESFGRSAGDAAASTATEAASEWEISGVMLQRDGSRCNCWQGSRRISTSGGREREGRNQIYCAGVARTVRLCAPAAKELAVPRTCGNHQVCRSQGCELYIMWCAT